MLKIYAPLTAPPLNSSAGRCFLLLEEIGLDYEKVGLDFSKREHKSTEYLKLNPNGKIPVLDDDGFILWESMAINNYLAKKHKPELLGKDIMENALVDKWGYWVSTEITPPIVQLMAHTRFLPEEKRSQEVAESSKQKFVALCQVLEGELEGKEYLVGNTYTLADLHVSLGVSVGLMFGIDFSSTPKLEKWLQLMMSRPAFKKLMR